MTAALRLVEAANATAMSYLTVVWGLILGYLFFYEVCNCPNFLPIKRRCWCWYCSHTPTQHLIE